MRATISFVVGSIRTISPDGGFPSVARVTHTAPSPTARSPASGREKRVHDLVRRRVDLDQEMIVWPTVGVVDAGPHGALADRQSAHEGPCRDRSRDAWLE